MTRHCCLFLLLAIFFSNLFGTANAQKTERDGISGRYENIGLLEVIHQIEDQSGYFFYYDSTAIDSIRVNLFVEDQPVSSVLELALKNTTLRFSIDDEKHVFITNGYAIQTLLARGLLDGSIPDSVNRSDSLMAFLAGKQKPILPFLKTDCMK